jgi:Na+-translocating ferredoxin:NAD+ oxidoreductase subunit G
MKKIASTFTSMFLVLGGVSVLAAAALASVQKLTEEPIRKAALAAQETAIKAVVPTFDNSPVEEQYWLPTSEGDSLCCFPASKGGKLQGVAIESYSRNGYGGLIKVMVGLEPDGRVHGFSVLSHAETPGLGSNMETWFKTNKPGQYVPGLHPAETKLRVRKDGGDVDAITAATITSRAFLEAIDLAYKTYTHHTVETPNTHKESTEADGVSGASQSY